LCWAALTSGSKQAKDSYCDQCSTQCAPWKRSAGWSEGVGWYGSSDCTACRYDPAMCAGNQFLDMSTCGPGSPPECTPCPGVAPVANQAGWLNPRDAAFNGVYPCRVLCAAGYTEVDDQCVFCQNLPANVILVSGCDWRCKPGFLQNGNQCVACPPQPECSVGSYPDFQGSSNVCLTCFPCQRPSNATLVTSGTFAVAASCAYRCNAGYYRSGDICAACTQRACVSGQTFLAACSSTADSRCTACRTCSMGERLASPCTLTNNSVCAACDATLRPDNAAWVAVGCDAWACVPGFWNDGGVCRRCSVQKDCGLGSTLQVMASLCTGTSGRCVACPPLAMRECYNGDPYCGTTKVCSPAPNSSATPSPKSTQRPPGSSAAPISSATPNPKSTPRAPGSSAAPTTGLSPKAPTTVPAPNTTTSAEQPVAYASLASLTISPLQPIDAKLLNGLVANISLFVCADVSGYCNVSVAAVTLNGVTTFCSDGACPGYSGRRMLGTAAAVVDVVIVTQIPISDVLLGFQGLPAVDDVVVLPNSPVASLTSGALGDSKETIEQVRKGHTVFNQVVVQPAPSNFPVAVVVVIVCCAAVIVTVVVLLRRKRVVLVADSKSNAAEARFAFLENIRIADRTKDL
jgi:hypothetical protein